MHSRWTTPNWGYAPITFCHYTMGELKAVSELCVLEHLKLHAKHGYAERVPPPCPVANPGHPRWFQDVLSFVAKQRNGKSNCSLQFLASDFCKVQSQRSRSDSELKTQAPEKTVGRARSHLQFGCNVSVSEIVTKCVCLVWMPSFRFC